jgi:hypothetical protein
MVLASRKGWQKAYSTVEVGVRRVRQEKREERGEKRGETVSRGDSTRIWH